MHSCICCNGRRIFQTVCISCIALASIALLGLVGEADSPPICLHSPPAQLSLALGFYFYKVCSPTPWILALYGFSSVSIQYKLLRGLLCCLGYFWLFPVLTFFEGALKLSGELEGAFCTNLYWGYVLIFSAVSLSYTGWPIHSADIVWRHSCGIILVPGFPSDKGAPKFLEGLLCDCERCPWELLPYLLVSSSLEK